MCWLWKNFLFKKGIQAAEVNETCFHLFSISLFLICIQVFKSSSPFENNPVLHKQPSAIFFFSETLSDILFHSYFQLMPKNLWVTVGITENKKMLNSLSPIHRVALYCLYIFKFIFIQNYKVLTIQTSSIVLSRNTLLTVWLGILVKFFYLKGTQDYKVLDFP